MTVLDKVIVLSDFCNLVLIFNQPMDFTCIEMQISNRNKTDCEVAQVKENVELKVAKGTRHKLIVTITHLKKRVVTSPGVATSPHIVNSTPTLSKSSQWMTSLRCTYTASKSPA